MSSKFLNIGLALLLAVFSVACSKEEDQFDEQKKTDDAALQQYIATQQLTAVKTNSGLYHVVEKQGTGTSAVVSQVAEVNFKVSLLDGKTVSEGKNYVFKPQVGSFMYGLTEGVTLMKEGGKSRFLVPSYMAFGAASGTLNNVYVPAYSPVILEVELIDVRTDTEQADKEAAMIEAYIERNNMTVTSAASGVYYVRTKEGTTNVTPKAGSSGVVDYTGKLLDDGSVFDKGTNFRFEIGAAGLIKGWNEGVAMMKEGEKGLLFIPSHMAYGASGSQGKIPPYGALIFEMDLKKIQ